MITIPHLETNVTVACQLRCVACNHFVALQTNEAKSRLADPRQMEEDLMHLSRVLHADAYGMLGGEPLLHPGLVELLQIARESRIADTLEVWTNGLRVRQQKQDFWRSFDRLVVSVYPGTLCDDELTAIGYLSRDYGVELVVKDERSVPNFERLLEPHETNESATNRKYATCFFKNFSRVVDRGYFYRCCTSPFIPRLLLGLPEGTDGILVKDIRESSLNAFLNQKEAMSSCRICSGLNPNERHRVVWHEQRNPEQWLAASAGSN